MFCVRAHAGVQVTNEGHSLYSAGTLYGCEEGCTARGWGWTGMSVILACLKFGTERDVVAMVVKAFGSVPSSRGTTGWGLSTNTS